MAEVVGAVAAVVQFVDVALRLSSCLERFCSDVRNVPRRFVQLQTDLRQQIEIAQQIQNHRLPGFATTVSASTFNTPLVEYIGLAEELCKTLEALLARKNDGVFQRGWDAICSVRKKEEVASICDRLEQKKSTLSLWLEAANLELALSIAVTTAQTQLDAGETLRFIKTVDSTSNKIAAGTAQLVSHVEHIGRNLATTSTTTERILQDTQRLLIRYDADVTAREVSRQITATTLANTARIIAAIGALSANADKYSPRAQRGYVTDHTYVGSLSGQKVQTSTVYQGRRPRRCRCRTVSTARRWQPLSILRFTRTFQTQHFSSCPDYQNSEQSLEVTMQIVPPSWLVSRTIDVGTRVRNWSTTNCFSISPIVIGTSRLVDPNMSPAFRAIANTKEKLYKSGQHHLLIPQLQATLKVLFDEQEASVLDTDSNGNTLLNKIIWLCTAFPCIISKPGDEYAALVQFLLNIGADPNVLRFPTLEDSLAPLGSCQGTTCDQLAGPVAQGLSGHFTKSPLILKILGQIQDAGGHSSRPYMSLVSSGYRSRMFLQESKQLTFFEDQIDVLELGELVPVILQRNEEQFRRLVQKAKLSVLDRKSPVNGSAPIHFAVLWPIGLRLLVDRGVNVNTEDTFGRRPIHLAVALGLTDSVACLLGADCGLFTPSYHDSLVQHALELQSPHRSQILHLLISALINRHTRLVELASSYLPPSLYSKLNLLPGQLHEQKAPSIIEVLLSNGIDIPEALELDGESFYNFSDMHGRIELVPTIAEMFWNAGFRDINTPDDCGVTPFLQSWFMANFAMVGWFTERGISMQSEHKDARLSALHFYAKRLDYPGSVFLHDIDAVPTHQSYMEDVQKELGIPHDDCTCVCSPTGCTPVKFISESRMHCMGLTKRRVRAWIENVRPPQTLKTQYIYDFTRSQLFNFLEGEHTCCFLGQRCSVQYLEPRVEHTESKRFQRVNDMHTDWEEHAKFCHLGIPIPQKQSLQALRDGEKFKIILDNAMSHYDEMERPDTMPVEEQVFEYINWIISKGYLAIDVSYECHHDGSYDSTDYEYDLSNMQGTRAFYTS